MILSQTLGGHYKVVKKLGSGAFGETYLAQDLHLPDSPLRVVKVFKPLNLSPAQLPTTQRLFNTEAEVLYQLGEHDSIPKLYAHFEENNQFFLVQEYIEGQDLSHEIKPGVKLSEKQALRLLQELLEILAFVHQHNIIHRYLKPANIMRRQQDGKLFLIDFGAVKQILSSQGNLQPTVAVGTKGYMPPEQVGGYPQLASDLYAVGMVIIESLTGIRPDLLPCDPQTNEVQWQGQINLKNLKFKQILEQMVADSVKKRFTSASKALKAVRQLTQPQPNNLKQLVIYSCIVIFSLVSLVTVIQLFTSRQTPQQPQERIIY